MMRLTSGVITVALAFFASAAPAQESSLKTLKVGGGSFTTSVGRAHGTFAKYGLQVELPRGPAGGSEEVRRWLASGELDVADYGVDNAIAMVENAGVDVVVVAATDSTPTELVAQPEIKSLADLRGKTVLVDAPNTQNALALKKILATAGLKAGTDYHMKGAGGTSARVAAMLKDKQYAATMASGQTAAQARQQGLVSLATTANIVGPMLRYGVFTRRTWAAEKSDLLIRYLAAHIEAQRWIMDPANKDKVIDRIAEQRKLPRALAAGLYQMDMGPDGLAKDAAIDVKRLANVLRFRAEVEGSWGGKPPSAERYYDPSYHKKALLIVNANAAK
ncbi:MAG TPA: ABC transporter substrate-binding protein [Candidatus Acidoferrales bacterium]|nr:ABC transporter substrate-binding protein [Candidatus Acidoferrales bacterium]